MKWVEIDEFWVPFHPRLFCDSVINGWRGTGQSWMCPFKCPHHPAGHGERLVWKSRASTAMLSSQAKHLEKCFILRRFSCFTWFKANEGPVKVSLLMVGGQNEMVFEVLSNPDHSVSLFAHPKLAEKKLNSSLSTSRNSALKDYQKPWGICLSWCGWAQLDAQCLTKAHPSTPSSAG